MKKIMDLVTGRRGFLSLFKGGDNGQTVFIATPHKLITIEDVVCRRDQECVVLEFSIRNRGAEISCFGLKVINNFDPQGREYDHRLSFGRNSTPEGAMVHYTLPQDIPVKVRVVFTDVPADVTHIAQVKFSGVCIRNRRHNKKYNPSGILLLRNIPVCEV